MMIRINWCHSAPPNACVQLFVRVAVVRETGIESCEFFVIQRLFFLSFLLFFFFLLVLFQDFSFIYHD